MATASNTQFKVENGLLVVGGNANLDVNTTITSTLTATANVVITGNVVSNIVPQAHDTYNLGNTTFRWIVYGSNVVANSVVAVTANLSGNVWITGSPATFNANTGVNNTTDVITTGATHGLTVGDYVFYYTSTGNTVLSGLTNATAYYVASAPTTTTLTLSTTYGGAQVNITASTTSETGHNLIPIEILLSTNGAIHAPGGSGIVNVNTLRVLGGATVNGATTLANTLAAGNTTITGFINVSSTADVTGAVSITNTVASGNTTITGFINVSSTANVGGATNLRSTLTVNGAVTIANTFATGNTTVTGFANVSTTLNVAGNTTVNGAFLVNNTAAVGNTTITGTANIIGSSATFNANTGVNNTTDVITTGSAHGFTAGDYVQYIVSAGNTAVSGLTNGSYYYVASTPASTTLTLSTTYGGAQVNITASTTSETGHTLFPHRIRLSTSGNIDTTLGIANVGSLRVLGAATVNGLSTLAQTTIGGNVAISANVAVDTDLLVLDTVNNLIGLKNAAPLSTDLVTVGGNVVFNASNTTGLRFIATNTSYNTAITLVANSTNSRITFTTWGSTNSSINDGGYLLNLVNSTSTYAGLFINLNKFEYLGGNVAHAGNFGIYDSTGTRVGP